MQALLTLLFLCSSFTQKWYIPCGSSAGSGGRICIEDTDRDGNCEFFISNYSTSFKIYIYELHLPNMWEKDSFSYFWGPLLWDIGDYDLDGLFDLDIETAVDTPPSMIISIAESPDSFSYPTQEVWRDTVGPALVIPDASCDIDQDGLPEIIKMQGDYTDFDIYECIGNNLYSCIFRDTISDGSMSTLAFGDFDLDDRNEFVFGNAEGRYFIWECLGNNMYEEIIANQQLPTVNIMDCFSVPDADQDGKMEFVVKGFWVSGTIDAFIFEAIADNTYEIIKTFSLPGGDYYGGYSDAGDVDGDSVAEIVLEAMNHVYIIKSAGNDSFYISDSLPGHGVGSNIRVVDVDNNGLNDIVISGGNETRIYEYMTGVEETPKVVESNFNCIRVYPNPFRKYLYLEKIPTDADMRIYDISGQLVKRFNQPFGVNKHLLWNAYNDKGKKIVPGIYFVQIKSNNKVFSLKVIYCQ